MILLYIYIYIYIKKLLNNKLFNKFFLCLVKYHLIPHIAFRRLVFQNVNLLGRGGKAHRTVNVLQQEPFKHAARINAHVFEPQIYELLVFFEHRVVVCVFPVHDDLTLLPHRFIQCCIYKPLLFVNGERAQNQAALHARW